MKSERDRRVNSESPKTCDADEAQLRRAAQARFAQAGNRWRRRVWSSLTPYEKRRQLDAAVKMIQTQVKD